MREQLQAATSAQEASDHDLAATRAELSQVSQSGSHAAQRHFCKRSCGSKRMPSVTMQNKVCRHTSSKDCVASTGSYLPISAGSDHLLYSACLLEHLSLGELRRLDI